MDVVVTCPLTYTSDYSLALEKQHPVTIGSDDAPFTALINLILTIITENFCQKQRADFLETYVWHSTLLSSSSHNPAYVGGVVVV